MRIFFVCQRVPFPPNRGDKIITFHEVRHLAKEHEVHVFCLADGVRDLENVSPLRRFVNTVTAIPVDKIKKKLRIIRALASGKPLSVAALNEPKLHEVIRKRYFELKPQLIFVYSGNVAQYAEPFHKAARIMQFHDLDSLKWGEYAARTRAPLRWLYKIEKRRLLAYERRISSLFSHSLVSTTTERDDFRQLMPAAPISIVSNGVDLSYFKSARLSKKKFSLIFSGVMDYLPNEDAVLWFCDEIFPMIRSRVTTATLTVCGSNPTLSIQALARREGVTVTGRVPDTRPYLDEAEISIAPLRIARGIQNKLLEAMAMGLPVVTSTKAWKGTMIDQDDGILVADEPQQFANHVVRLLSDKTYRLEMSRKARAAVEAKHRWDIQLAKLDEVVLSVSQALHSHPTASQNPSHITEAVLNATRTF